MVRANTEINSRQVPEALKREAAGGEQRKGQREFGDHQGAASVASRSAGARSSTLFEYFVKVEPGGLPGRSRSEQQTRDDSNGNREHQYRHADSDVRLRRQHRTHRWHDRPNQVNYDSREQYA